MAYLQESIMLLGDSLTQGSYDHKGIAARLAHVYNRKLDVVNRGFSGYNAPWAKIIFKSIFPNKEQQAHLPRIRLLVMWFGANDAVLPHKSQHVPLPIFSSALSSIIRIVWDPSSSHFSPGTKILLLTPPPFSVRVRKANLDSRKPHPLPMDRDWETTKAYAEAVKAVARKEEVPVVDCWTDIWHVAGQDEIALEGFLTDGLHLNEKGYEVVYNGLIEAIKTHFPEMHPDNIQSIFPPWENVNERDPASSLLARVTEARRT